MIFKGTHWYLKYGMIFKERSYIQSALCLCTARNDDEGYKCTRRTLERSELRVEQTTFHWTGSHVTWISPRSLSISNHHGHQSDAGNARAKTEIVFTYFNTKFFAAFVEFADTLGNTIHNIVFDDSVLKGLGVTLFRVII